MNIKIAHITKIILFLLISVIPIGMLAAANIYVDPYFHYHKPFDDKFYYEISRERYRNSGIVKHFDYDGIITGDSMAELFRVSEAQELFECKFVRVTFPGGSYKEINDCVKTALDKNPKVSVVIRDLGYGEMVFDKDYMRTDMGEFPSYLYDDNVVNDISTYICNRDLFINQTYEAIKKHKEGIFGLESFDKDPFMTTGVYGVLDDLYSDTWKQAVKSNDNKVIMENVVENAMRVADEHTETTFLYFFPPVSAAWWGERISEGSFEKLIEIKRILIEESFNHKNIKLYGFENLTDITTDRNNYKDSVHYGEWVNSIILKYMSEDTCLISPDNYMEYLTELHDYYSNFNYDILSTQNDYEQDYFAAALQQKRISSVEPKMISFDDNEIILSGAKVSDDPEREDVSTLKCIGYLDRRYDENELSTFLYQGNFIGVEMAIDGSDRYKYLTFMGKKNKNNGQIGVYVFDTKGNIINSMMKSYKDLDYEWHQYIVYIPKTDNVTKVIINGAYPDNTGASDSEFEIKDIVLY